MVGVSRVLTLVFTDLADSTALKTEHGDQVVGEWIARHRVHVTELAERQGGRIVDWAGDGCFLTFETSSGAVGFALRLQEAHHREPDLPGVRIGVHVGEVTETSIAGMVRVEGLIVDLSARIGALATPGQVLVSAPVQHSAKQRLDVHELSGPVRWETYGPYRLKGFDEAVDVREAGLAGMSPFRAPGASEKAWPEREANRERDGEARAIRRLAVLPFRNLSGATDQEWFVDGMTETLIAELAKIQALTVISRTSVMFYKNATKPLPEIARELAVDGIVEGSVLRAGDKVRITAQLIEASRDAHLWADRYDGTMEEVLDLQSDVALAIAREVNVTLLPEQEIATKAPRPVNPRAFDALMRAKHQTYEATAGSVHEALRLVAEAIAIDPEDAEAWAAAAAIRAQGVAMILWMPREVYFDAKVALREAMRLDRDSPEVSTAGAAVARTMEWDWDRTIEFCEEALRRSPSHSGAQVTCAYGHLYRGEIDVALEHFAVARDLDPRHPGAFQGTGAAYLRAGRLDEAVTYNRASAERFPLPGIFANLTAAYLRLGRHAEAVEVCRTLAGVSGRRPWATCLLGFCQAVSGGRDDARSTLEELRRRSGEGSIGDFFAGVVELALGLRDEAYPRFERAYRDLAFLLLWAHRVRLFRIDAVELDERFERLLSRLDEDVPAPQPAGGKQLVPQSSPVR